MKIEVGHLNKGKAEIYSTVPVTGSLSPFVPGQKVEVEFFVDGKRVERKTVAVGKGKGGSGTFRAKIRIEQAGPIFDVPVTVAILYEDKTTEYVTVKVRGALTEQRIPLHGRLRKDGIRLQPVL